MSDRIFVQGHHVCLYTIV